MEGLIITSKGIEEIAAIEIKELINANRKAEEGCVVFNFNKLIELCLLCYKCQSADKVLYLIGKFEFENFFKDFEKFINEIKFDEWFDNNKKFKVECVRMGIHDFNSIDVQTKTIEFIFKKCKNENLKVDFKDYEIIFLVYIVDNKCYFGVDFAGFELNKRSYKIFLHPNSLRGTISYALVRESGFEKRDIMLDPFCRDGVIPIEAALSATNFPCNYYKKDQFAFLKFKLDIDFDKFFSSIDKKIKKNKVGIYSYDHLFKYVDYSRKNAKIAGIDKFINFSRVELEWLDIKFKQENIDRIITNPPISSNVNLDKVYNEFFYQSTYVLKNDGTLALISKIPDLVKNYATRHNFVISKEKNVWSGAQLLKIMIFKKKNI